MAEEIVTILRFDTGQSVQTLRDLRENIKAYKKELEGLDIGTEEYRQTLVRLQTNQAAVRFAMQGTTASLEDINAAAQGVGKSYNSLSTQLSVLQREQRNINIATDEGKARYAEMAAQINAVNDELKALDAQNGNFRRNVGNYQSAFNGLNMATAQIMRELPALGMNVNTFFLAISNNIPMLVDQIQLLREQNRQLLADGKQGFSVFRQFLKSFISLNSLMSIGVTLLTLYGGKLVEWIGSLLKGKDALEESAEAAQEWSDALDEIERSVVKATAETQAYYGVATDLNRSMADRLAAAEKLREMHPDYLGDIDAETIAAGGAADAYGRLTSALEEQARAKASLDRITQEYTAQLDAQLKLEEAQVRLQEALRSKQSAERLLQNAAPNQIQSLSANVNKAVRDVQAINDEIAAYNEQIATSNEHIEALSRNLTAAGIQLGSGSAGTAKLAEKTVKLKLDTELDIDEEDIQSQLDTYLSNMHASNRGYEKMQLDEISSTAAADIRRTNLSILQNSEETAAKVYEIEMSSMQRRLELMKVFEEQASREGDQEAALDYHQEIADLEVEIELREMEEKKRIYEQDVKNKEAAAKARQQIAQQAADAVSGILDSLADVYEANSEGNEKAAQQAKNLRIASTIIETISGAVAAYMGAVKAFSGIPGIGPGVGMAMGALNAATVLAAGYAQVEKIRNTEVSRDSAPSGGSSASAFATAPAVPSQPEQVRTVTSASEEERLNRMADDQRVYVLASDIEAAQRSRRVRVRESTF